MKRLAHDTAVAMAHTLLERVKPCILEQEWSDAFNEFYEVCKAGIEAYECQVDRMQKRLRPMEN